MSRADRLKPRHAVEVFDLRHEDRVLLLDALTDRYRVVATGRELRGPERVQTLLALQRLIDRFRWSLRRCA